MSVADTEDESSSTSPLTQLISSENGDVSIAARILSMLMPCHDSCSKSPKIFVIHNRKYTLDLRKMVVRFLTKHLSDAAAQGAVVLICASDVEIEVESGVYRWAFAIRSTVGAQFAMFGITSNLQGDRQVTFLGIPI